MHARHQSSDPHLDRFEEWLRTPAVQPPANLAARIRARLRQDPDAADLLIDRLLRPDASLRDPAMVFKVRQRLVAPVRDRRPATVWFNWLTPLAAAATLMTAFVSFQMRAPQAQPVAAARTEAAPVVEDLELTRIFALASNLHESADMSKLESVENLAFLFD